ncbi:hypothetical protein BJ912DRAFT_988700 [Pholiota molesta]|nr:hypothetical protein BJ912DRAFT_988700 [Pholiota molesta]
MTMELAWVAKTSEAAAIMHACIGLQRLELALPDYEEVVEWSAMHPSIQSALAFQIQSSRLCELTLVNVNHIPLVFLAAFGSLRVLRLEQVSPSSPENQHEDPLGHKPSQANNSLKTLSITDSNQFLQLFLAERTLLSRLLVLDVGYTLGDASLIHDLLLNVRGIEEIYLTFLNAFGEVEVNHINIQPLQNLRHISLFTSLTFLDQMYIVIYNIVIGSNHSK